MLDPYLDEIARDGGTGEVHGRVAASSSAQQIRIGAAGVLDEDFLHPSDALCVARRRHALDDVDETPDAIVFHLFRDSPTSRR